ncbi:MAG: sugar phosphate isomerase/epimerase [Chitinophagaceae bacterium]
MQAPVTRRAFLIKTTMAATALAITPWPVASAIKLGYAAITWGDNIEQAIQQIAEAGFRGIQLRSNTLAMFGSKPQELLAMLEQHHLPLVMFSSGNANINTGDDEAVIKMHVDNARFVKSLKGTDMQITNSSRPKQGSPSKEDLQQFGRLLNEIGKRTADIGITTNYHNHMAQLGQTPEEVETILANCDNRNVRLLLDIAHYQQGGGDPVKAISHYRERIKNIHLKDVRQLQGDGAQRYQFVELGQGTVNLPAVCKALTSINFTGWGIVELDAVPQKDKTPLQCANISKAYLESIGVHIAN